MPVARRKSSTNRNAKTHSLQQVVFNERKAKKGKLIYP